MYIGLKQIQYQLGDYSTLLTSSDGIHALTGWNKLYDAPQPLTIHLLYTCTYTPELLSFPFIQDMHLLCIVPEDINMDFTVLHFLIFWLLITDCSQPSTILTGYLEIRYLFLMQIII